MFYSKVKNNQALRFTMIFLDFSIIISIIFFFDKNFVYPC